MNEARQLLTQLDAGDVAMFMRAEQRELVKSELGPDGCSWLILRPCRVNELGELEAVDEREANRGG